MNSTTVCLQQKLVPLVEQDTAELTCRSIKTTAFDSHPICYTGGGGTVPTDPSICFLPVDDWKCIISTVDPADLISPLGIEQEIKIAAICVQQLTSAGLCVSKTDERCIYWSARLEM